MAVAPRLHVPAIEGGLVGNKACLFMSQEFNGIFYFFVVFVLRTRQHQGFVREAAQLELLEISRVCQLYLNSN